MNKQDLGFGGGSKSNRIKYNEIKLDSEDGVFNYMKLTELKNEDGTYPTEKLKQNTLSGVILVVRRKLQMWSDTDEKTFATVEFNSNQEEITFYGKAGAEKGTADSLRAKYPLLKTLAVVYFYSPKKKEIVRLNCKGLGLQPEDNKAMDYKGLFQYLSSFDKEENPSDFMTTVLFVPKEITRGRKTKTYQAMRFERGEKIVDESVMNEIVKGQEEVLSQFSKEKVELKTESSSKIDEVVNDLKSDKVSYPEEDINIEDIPF